MKNITNEIEAIKNVPIPKKEKDIVKLMAKVVKRTGTLFGNKEQRFIVQREGFIYGSDFSVILRLKTDSTEITHTDLQGNVFPAQYGEKHVNQTVHRPEKEYMMPNFSIVIPEKITHIQTLSVQELLSLYQKCQKAANYQKKEGLVAVRLVFGTALSCFDPLLLTDAFKFILQAGEGEISLSAYKGTNYHGLCIYTGNALAYVMPKCVENDRLYKYVDLL